MEFTKGSSETPAARPEQISGPPSRVGPMLVLNQGLNQLLGKERRHR